MKAGKTIRTGQKRNRARSPGRERQEKNAGTRAAKAVVVPFSSPAPAQPDAVPSTAALVTFEADCTARYAEQLKAVLLGQLDVPERVSLDITAIERIDTVFLQLLTAFVRDRLQAGRSIVWRGHSEIFSRAARLLGLTAILSIADVP